MTDKEFNEKMVELNKGIAEYGEMVNNLTRGMQMLKAESKKTFEELDKIIAEMEGNLEELKAKALADEKA